MENTPIKSEEQPLVTSNSETATVAASDTDSTTVTTNNNNNSNTTNAAAEDSIATVNSSSPTAADPNDFPTSFQQLHEAVLAAVNSNSLPNSFFAAAAAAAAASQNVPIHPQTFDQTDLDQTQVQVAAQTQASLQSHSQPQHTEKPAKRTTAISELDEAKRESIRASNRERKKKWRLHNEERNKDNDLRCRVNKRANKVFGAEDSPQKQAWIQEEFEKRRQKRMDKERRKHIVNNVLSVPSAASNIPTGSAAESSTTTPTATPRLDDNLAAQNLAQANQLANSFYLPQIDTEAAAKILGLSSDLHRQLLEQLNGNLMALSNGILQSTQAAAAAAAAENLTPTITNEQTNSNNDTTMTEAISPTHTEDHKSIEISQIPTTSDDTALLSNNTSTNEMMTVDGESKAAESEDKTTSTSTENITEEKTNEDIMSKQLLSTSTEENKQEDGGNEDGREEKKSEYPMDAVLTLMQLNAGWRH
ncbi:hypothetical protein BDF20DRAFT_917092 [Mycotypha africana]|uniref:uncharacterized protein n=1 Tax=Mycotypha africana TaxID=64632 RepID=UPI002301C986|nr:uncharacterized protein BDF20DRAFT_917092 [Mycotypha africana]KAI8968599.1 hypothetical protein BDF20DRAFT_917092 [Mycotypha africana]